MLGPLLHGARARWATGLVVLGGVAAWLTFDAGGWPFLAAAGVAVAGWLLAVSALARPPAMVKHARCRCGAVARSGSRCLGCGR